MVVSGGSAFGHEIYGISRINVQLTKTTVHCRGHYHPPGSRAVSERVVRKEKM